MNWNTKSKRVVMSHEEAFLEQLQEMTLKVKRGITLRFNAY